MEPMGKLNSGGADEIMERYREGLAHVKEDMIKSGKFNQDGADLIVELIDEIVHRSAREQKMFEDEIIIRRLEGMGIDKWGREAKKKMHESGLKTKNDYRAAMEIAKYNGVMIFEDDGKPDLNSGYVIYEGWNND
jgi:hypothetical protein